MFMPAGLPFALVPFAAIENTPKPAGIEAF
jgi:hypothetical protein